MADEQLYRWSVAPMIEDGGNGRVWERHLIAASVDVAVQAAIEESELKPGEHLHTIHVGPPKAV